MLKRLENKGQIFIQLVKNSVLLWNRNSRYCCYEISSNGRNAKAMDASSPLSGQYMIFPDMLFFLSRRIVNPTIARLPEGSPVICCPRLQVQQIQHIHNYTTTQLHNYTWIPDPEDVKYQLNQRDRYYRCINSDPITALDRP